MPYRRVLLAAAALLTTSAAHAAVGFKQVTTGLSQPVYLSFRGNNLIVAQQGGAIVAVNRSTGAKTPFFTVPNIESGGEKGLLGLAFDPGYSRNGRFYVNVTTRVGGQLFTEVRRYTNTAVAAAESPLLVLRVAQPFDNHNGGWIDFGADKKLYVALGDGGGTNDPQNNAQNLSSKLGKILRVDVARDAYPADPLRNYAIPADNPFGTEVFAYGLRNPYRNSFDRTTGDLWIGDVGQGAREEVDRIASGTSGQNFGWRPLEGTIPTPGVGGAIPPGTTAPVLEYDHSFGRSITGGYVYRGAGLAELSGKYVFGDFVTGRLFTMGLDGTGFTDISGSLGSFGPLSPASFGQDGNRNLYVVDYGGRILKFQATPGTTLASATLAAAAVPEPAAWTLMIAGFGLVGAAARRQGRRISLPKLPPE